MTEESRKAGSDGGPSPMDQLRDQMLEYAASLGKKAVGKVTDKLTAVAEGGEGGGGVAGAAAAAAKGENPMTAFAKQKATDVKDKVVGGAKGALGMGGGSGKAGDLKAINIIEHIDVSRPLKTVYNQWSQIEDLGKFTNGVSNVSLDDEDETKSNWKVRVWPSTRTWEATVEEQIPDVRIVWNSEGSKGTTHGAVSFHRLEENLTRVAVAVEYYPSGFVEKVGNIWRAQGRRLRLDLKHFQRYVTLQGEEVEGWRGEIRDGEVVRSHEEVVQQEQEEDQGDRDGQGGEGEDRDDRDGQDGEGEEGEEEEDDQR